MTLDDRRADAILCNCTINAPFSGFLLHYCLYLPIHIPRCLRSSKFPPLAINPIHVLLLLFLSVVHEMPAQFECSHRLVLLPINYIARCLPVRRMLLAVMEELLLAVREELLLAWLALAGYVAGSRTSCRQRWQIWIGVSLLLEMGFRSVQMGKTMEVGCRIFCCRLRRYCHWVPVADAAEAVGDEGEGGGRY
ncbi:hypothetical protein ACLOJK_037489 [Asimina triloba]